MTYLYLALAISAEVLATTFLKLSDGFSRPLPSFVTVIGYVVAFYFLSLTLRSLSGEVIRVQNSQVLATRVVPHGVRELEIEFFVSDAARGQHPLLGRRLERPGHWRLATIGLHEQPQRSWWLPRSPLSRSPCSLAAGRVSA